MVPVLVTREREDSRMGRDTEHTRSGGEDTRIGRGREDTRLGREIEDVRLGRDREDTRIGNGRENTRIGGGRDDTRLGRKREDTRIGRGREDTRIGGEKENTKLDRDNQDTRLGREREDIRLDREIEDASLGGEREDARLCRNRKDTRLGRERENTRTDRRREDTRIGGGREDTRTDRGREETRLGRDRENKRLGREREATKIGRRRDETKPGREDARVGKEDTRLGREDTRLGIEDTKLGREYTRLGKDREDTTLDREDTRPCREDVRFYPEDTRLDREDTRLGREDTRLGREDTKIGREDTRLRREDTRLGRGDTRLGREDTRLGREDTRLGREDVKLDIEYTRPCIEDTRLGRVDTRLCREDMTLDREDTTLEREDSRLDGEETRLEREDTGLDTEYTRLGREYTRLGREYTTLCREYTRLGRQHARVGREREDSRLDEGTSDSDSSDSAPAIGQRTSHFTYSQQLEDYIARYRRRPPDIKYWPYGPYWPRYHEGVILPPPTHIRRDPPCPEPLANPQDDEMYEATQRTADTQETQFGGRWRGILIVFDSERSARDQTPPPNPTDCCPSLVFESRFESGNLRQARRTGQFDYELVLRTDLYTNRHTQWYYFRVQNMVPGVTYRFRVVNLLKRNSLYNLGMRPLLYSEKDAQNRQIGWRRTGHHISYSRNVTNLHCPLLQRGVAYYMLEWQMEFEHGEDTCYLAHCYPYTFTDLKEDLDTLQECQQRSQWLRREVLCETRAGNSCFLLTITNFDEDRGGGRGRKKAVVVTARVHPGESQASWMMKGLLDFLTSTHATAQELRSKYVFKVVPMLNPDGVIVGNYRCSLAARDLNRNYRHPRRESFPTVWHTKNMLEELMHKHEVLLYCDLHGHSRKHNVFMYGNNLTTLNGDVTPAEEAGPLGCNTFIAERLIPWLMSVKAPDKFSFASCKFHIKKCKESTGRVVMWRQMRIRNSFTLEAAFSGTTINNSGHRHFNTADFMSMGKTLGEVVLEYAVVQDSKMRQTETVLDLTRAVTHQVLESRGLLPSNFSPPSLDRIDNLGMSDDPLQQEADRWTMALINLLAKSAPPSKDAAPEDKVKDKGSKEDKVKGEKVKAAKRSEVSKKDVDAMLEKMSFKTLDGCMRILAQLNVRESIEVSDSSDSDSESEPEMPRHADKGRRKKRRSKKTRDRDQERKLLERKAEEQRSKSLSALPALACVQGSAVLTDSFPNPHLYRRQAGSSMDRYARLAKQYNFMSKYEGRSNGGVPCFTEERSMERQAKRMAEMKRKTEEDRQRDLSFYVVDGTPCYCQRSAPPAPLHPLQRALTQEDLSQKLQAAIAEGTPNLAQSLAATNVRTSYTHADNFRDLTPTVQPVNGLTLPSAAVRDSTGSGGESESEGDGGALLPLSARRTPYQRALPPPLAPHSLVPPAILKKLPRNAPMLKTVTRQIVTPADTPPLLASGILPPSRSPAIESDRREARLEERPRMGRTSGSLPKRISLKPESTKMMHAMSHEAVARCLAGSPHGEGIRYRSISEMSKLQADSITREYMKLLLDRSHR